MPGHGMRTSWVKNKLGLGPTFSFASRREHHSEARDILLGWVFNSWLSFDIDKHVFNIHRYINIYNCLSFFFYVKFPLIGFNLSA